MGAIVTARQVVESDLEYICGRLRDEFARLAGCRLLIAGGAGFLGYYFVQGVVHWNRTRGEGKPIALTVYDNYVRGVPDWLTALGGAEELTVVRHDVSDPLPSAVGDFQYIVHAASIASPTYYRRYPIETMDANVNGLRIMLDYARRQHRLGKRLGGFLFLSSSEIYGDPPASEIPTSESYRGNVSCTGPRACYDEAKRFGETLCVNFARQHDLPVRMVRPFNNYGPGLKITDRRVISDFARDAIAGRDIVMFSDGSPTRTFCYVADAIVGYYKVLVGGRSGEAYNIGVERPEVSMVDLAGMIAETSGELFGRKVAVVRRAAADGEYLTDNPSRRCPQITKARTELGFEPTVTLEDGLRRLLIWYGENGGGTEA